MLKEQFEKVYVINLERRQDRFERFFESLPSDWPFKWPERYVAIDGESTPHPRWWKGGNGAWGCYRTHLNILEHCLNDRIESVLILEDDAVCIEGFTDKAEMFWDHLPDDWNFVYLGGQHLQENKRLPRKVNEKVYRPYNVNRTHGYGLRGREILETVYGHFHEYRLWNVPHHVDHWLGELHKRTQTGLYVPWEWLLTQSEGKSDINYRNNGVLKFPGAQELVFPKIDRTGIAILGDYFGGGEIVAQVLHVLGLDFGNITDEQDRRLSGICAACYAEPWLTELLPYEDRVSHLRHWAGEQCSREDGGRYFCGQHPILSIMGEEILQAWPNPLFFTVERSPEECLRSMTSSPNAWNPDTFRRTSALLKQSRHEFLSKYQSQYFTISYGELVSEPESMIRKMCEFLKEFPSSERIQRAVDFVRDSHTGYRPVP